LLWVLSVFFFFPFYFFKLGGYLVSLGVVGGVIGCALCLCQTDIKSFIAYSSVCHMGCLLAGIYSFLEGGFLGGIIIAVSHGFCSSCLFYISYVVFKRYYSRSFLLLKGVLFYFPLLGMFIFLFLILNIGVPPSLSFFSEVFLFVGVSGYSVFMLSFLFFFVLLGGMCIIYFFVLLRHGFSVSGSFSNFLFVKELLLFYVHLFVLVLIPFFISFFL